MSTPSELARTRRHDTIEAEIAARGAIDPATLEAIRALEAEEGALQRQLRDGEMTQDDYDERWSTLVETTSPAVLKATLERQETVKAARGNEGAAAEASPARPPSP
jgi:hypothetical protein